MLKRKFDIPFSGSADLNFIHVLSTVLLYMEQVTAEPDESRSCARVSVGTCNGCDGCRGKLARIQENVYYLLDTMCGRSALRCRFDGTPTEMQLRIGDTPEEGCGTADNVDFLFGYIGYAYSTVTDRAVFAEAISASLSADRPVIARVGGAHGRYRVLIDAQEDRLREPDYTGVQKMPTAGITYAELEQLYIIGAKTARRYTEADALRRIVQIMEFNETAGLWDEYEQRIGWYGGVRGLSPDERAARLQRVAETMWYTFNSHNFAEVFRRRISAELQESVFDEIQSVINPTNGYTHDLAWALIGLNELPLGNQHIGITIGYAEMIQLVLGQIHKNDLQLLSILRQTLNTIKNSGEV